LQSRLEPTYDGSMWTAGFTFYFQSFAKP